MATFIHCYDARERACILNLNHVRVFRYRQTRDGREVPVAYADDGETYECYSVEALISPIIPAQPGFNLLTVWFYGDVVPDDHNDLAERVNKDDIIAWRMSSSGPIPITAEGDSELGFRADLTAIQDPAGKIILPEDSSFDTFDAFLIELRDRHKKYIERLRERAERCSTGSPSTIDTNATTASAAQGAGPSFN